MMKIRVLLIALALASPAGIADAQGLLRKIGEGANKAAEAVGKGADQVGEAVGKGADQVGKSFDSTVDLVTNEATPEETRAKLDAMADAILARLLAENPDAGVLFDLSAGYAVFDSRKVSVFPVSAGYGRGVAIARESASRTYMNMGTGGLGAAFGIGGFETQFVILFETLDGFDEFVRYGYDATAETGAMYGDDKSEETLRFVEGRSFFVLSKKGWRVNANASGTKYWKSPELN